MLACSGQTYETPGTRAASCGHPTGTTEGKIAPDSRKVRHFHQPVQGQLWLLQSRSEAGVWQRRMSAEYESLLVAFGQPEADRALGPGRWGDQLP
jgi:hypothetical protein